MAVGRPCGGWRPWGYCLATLSSCLYDSMSCPTRREMTPTKVGNGQSCGIVRRRNKSLLAHESMRSPGPGLSRFRVPSHACTQWPRQHAHAHGRTDGRTWPLAFSSSSCISASCRLSGSVACAKPSSGHIWDRHVCRPMCVCKPGMCAISTFV